MYIEACVNLFVGDFAVIFFAFKYSLSSLLRLLIC